MSGPPPRHPPIAAVEGFPLPRDCLAASRRIRRLSTQPPAATQAVPLQDHGGQGRIPVPAQPDLKLEDLHVHSSGAARHPAVYLPPVDALVPPDGLGSYIPLPPFPEHRRRKSIPAGAHYYLFHMRNLRQGCDNIRRFPDAQNPATAGCFGLQ